MFVCIFEILLALSQGQGHHNSIRLRAVPKEKGLRKGRITDNTAGNEIPVAHTTQNSHWSKSMCPSIKSELHNTLDCEQSLKGLKISLRDTSISTSGNPGLVYNAYFICSCDVCSPSFSQPFSFGLAVYNSMCQFCGPVLPYAPCQISCGKKPEYAEETQQAQKRQTQLYVDLNSAIRRSPIHTRPGLTRDDPAVSGMAKLPYQ